MNVTRYLDGGDGMLARGEMRKKRDVLGDGIEKRIGIPFREENKCFW